MFSMKPRIFFQTVEQTTGGSADDTDGGADEEGVAFEAYTDGPAEQVEAEQPERATTTPSSEESVPEPEEPIEEPDAPSGSKDSETDTSEEEDPLVVTAESLGWTDDEIAEAQQAGKSLFRKMLQSDIERAQARYQQQMHAQQTQQVPPQPKQGEQQARQETPVPPPTTGFEIKLDPEEYGEDLVNTVKSLQGHYESQLAQLRAEVNAQRDMEIQRQQEVIERELDEAFTSLPEEWKGVFGEGDLHSISDQEYEARNAVYAEAETLQLSRLDRGMDPLPWKRLVAAAANNVFPNKTSELARKDISKKLKNRSTIQRPTQRGRDKKTVYQSAMDVVDEHLERMGIGDDVPAIFPE